MGIIFSNKELSTENITCGGRFNVILTLTAEPNTDPVSPGATNVVVSDTVSDCFRIIGLFTPTQGTASLNDSNNIIWTIPSLGEIATETASLEFTVEHIGPC